jgi:tyrosine-protein kinase Etk/Wzc
MAERAHVASQNSTPDAESGLGVLDILIVLAMRKALIVTATLGAALIAAVVSLLWPHTFTATSRLMPPQQTQSLATAVLGQLGLSGGLSSAALGLRSPSDLYVSILKGRTVADAIIARFKLKELYDETLDVDARRALQRRVFIGSGRDGIITIEVEDRDAARAAAIANGFVEELERLTFTMAMTEAGQRRLFFEKQLRLVRDDLTNAEVALRQFLEGSGLSIPEGQAQITVAAAAQLQAEIAAKEVQLSSMRSFASDKNPELIRSEQELKSLRYQLARLGKNTGGSDGDVLVALRKLPGAYQAYLQRLRDVKYQETLFELLSKQYEVAKIEEAKNSVIIQVIDRAAVPDKRSWPKRTLIVVLSGLAALMLSIVYVVLCHVFERWKNDPLDSGKLSTLRKHISFRL